MPHHHRRLATGLAFTFTVLLLAYGLVARAHAAPTMQRAVASVFFAAREPALACFDGVPRHVLARYPYGVAHKSLPCGTKLRLCYRGRCITARVIDRGPYVAGRDLDLDVRVAAALHFPYGVAPLAWRVAR